VLQERAIWKKVAADDAAASRVAFHLAKNATGGIIWEKEERSSTAQGVCCVCKGPWPKLIF